MYKLLSVVLLSLTISACGILDPWIYKVDKQQGNITDEKLVEKVEIGMTKEQVRFLMGTPMAVDSFNQDRWDYFYSYKSGYTDKLTTNNITMFFEDNVLIRIEGDPLIKKAKPLETDNTGESDS